MKPMLPTLDLQFRRAGKALLPLPDQLAELGKFCQTLSGYSPLLGTWYLPSVVSKEDALNCPAFDGTHPSVDALTRLNGKYAGVFDVRTISVWNGAGSSAEEAALTSQASVLGRPDSISLTLKARPEVLDWRVGASWVQAALQIWSASFISFGPFWYSEKAVFQDKPGVSWMLYLPRVLTADQVPEARALVPVVDAKGVEGTIIVSVTDAPFSLENPEHVATANAIEVRLTDLDVLPRYADL